MKAVLLDLDGVIYQGERALPGAVETLHWLVDRQIPHAFLTNTTSKPVSAIVDKLKYVGVSVSADALVTPVIAAKRWLLSRHYQNIAALVQEPTLVDLDMFHLCPQLEQREVDAVIIGDLAEQWSYPLLNWAFRLLLNNPQAALVALGMTRYCRAGDELRLDVAPFVSALQCATDREPIVTGKPGHMMFEMALDLVGGLHGSAVMIGDDIHSDIGGALDAGLDALLVKTGKFREEDLKEEIQPTAVISSISEFRAWYENSDKT